MKLYDSMCEGDPLKYGIMQKKHTLNKNRALI